MIIRLADYYGVPQPGQPQVRPTSHVTMHLNHSVTQIGYGQPPQAQSYPGAQQQQFIAAPQQQPGQFGQPVPLSSPLTTACLINIQTHFTPPVVTGVPKDPDAIKLFVGSVPRHMTETDLRPFFEPYGEISEMVVLKDRLTGTSKGA